MGKLTANTALGADQEPPGPRPSAVVTAAEEVLVSAPPGALTLPRLLRKFSELALMASFLGAVLTYQLSLPEWVLRWMYALVTSLNGGVFPQQGGNGVAIFVKDFLPFAEGSIPILEVKTTVWLMIALLLVAVHFCARLYESIFHVPVFPLDLSPRPKRDWYRLIPFLCIVGFLIWSIASFSSIGWAPYPPQEALELIDAAKERSASGLISGSGILDRMARGWTRVTDALMSSRGGSFHAFTAWLQVAVALLFYLIAEDVIRTRRMVYKLIGLILAMGVLASLVAVLVHARMPLLRSIWVQWSSQDYRNDVSGFIGHNTAVSSFVIAPFLIAFTLLMAHRHRTALWVRALLMGGMVSMAMVLILAQSRAVIPILFLGFLSLLVLLARRATLRPTMSFWVAVPLVVLALLLTQFVRHDYNPLFRRNLPLESRLQHVTPQHLRSETRLRVLVCSLPVIGDNLLLGTSFGSFHYVYPQAQGEFFADHPDTLIVPTDKKSFHAHNEYLQTLFETGIVGLVLGLAGLLTILVAGWRTLESSFRQRHIAIELAIFVSILALLAHATVDFPLRVAPIACSLILLLAIWSAGDRLWLIPVVPLENRSPGTEKETVSSRVSSDFDGWKLPVRKAKAKTPVPLVVAWCCVSVLLAYGVTLGGAVACHWFASQTLTLRGTQLTNRYTSMVDGGEMEVLRQADVALKHAAMLLPLAGEADFHRGQVRYTVATEIARSRAAALQNNEEVDLNATSRAIIKEAGHAIELTNRSLAEFMYHGSYRQRGGANFLIATHLPGELRPQAEQFMREAIEDMEHSVLMNPGDPETINLLIRWKQNYARAGDVELRPLYFLIYHFHPNYFWVKIVSEVHYLSAHFQYKESTQLAARLLSVNPEDQELQRIFVSSAIFVGDYDAARHVNDQLARHDAPVAAMTDAFMAVLEGNPERGLYYLAQPMRGASETLRDNQTAMRIIIRARMAEAEGNEARAAELWSELRQHVQGDPMLSVQVARMLLQAFDLPGRARYYLDQSMQSGRFSPGTTDYSLQAEIQLWRFKSEIARLQEEQAAAAKRHAELPRATDPEMQRAIREAMESYDKAIAAGAVAEKEILGRVRRKLEALLPE